MAARDVAIVGGGPAGFAAAIACATAGLETTLVERAAFPRDRPGETLHPGVEPLFGKLGVMGEVRAAGFLRHDGEWVSWGGRPGFQHFGSDAAGPWQGFQAWRADLDAILERRAKQLGVAIHRAAALRPLHAGRHIVGVATSAGDVRAAVTIDAGGGTHWLARNLDIPLDAASAKRIAWYGYLSGDRADCDDAPRLVGSTGGWTWRARVRPGLYQWTRLAWRGSRPLGPPRALAHLAPCGRPRGADVTWRLARRTAGAGWFMAGDAAAVVDPAAAQGVLRALASGLMAAHCIVAMRAGRVTESHATTAYGAWLRRWFVHTTRAMTRLESRTVRSAHPR